VRWAKIIRFCCLPILLQIAAQCHVFHYGGVNGKYLLPRELCRGLEKATLSHVSPFSPHSRI
jgi:hypothetical protein